MRDAYPSPDDVESFLKSASYWPEVPDDDPKALRARHEAENGVAYAIGRWETLTGFTPFLTSPTADPVTFPIYWDGSTPVVQFGNGVVELLDASIGNSTLPFTPLVPGLAPSLRLLPGDGPVKNRPYLAMAFSPYSWNFYHRMTLRGPLQIDVTARVGFGFKLPEDAWGQIREYAALCTLIGVENLQNIGSLSIDGFSKTFDIVGVIDQKTILATWGKDFDKVAKRFERMVV